ncbi:hypothetical protein ACSSS7_006232 [Eimeria intestinalis]
MEGDGKQKDCWDYHFCSMQDVLDLGFILIQQQPDVRRKLLELWIARLPKCDWRQFKLLGLKLAQRFTNGASSTDKTFEYRVGSTGIVLGSCGIDWDRGGIDWGRHGIDRDSVRIVWDRLGSSWDRLGSCWDRVVSTGIVLGSTGIVLGSCGISTGIVMGSCWDRVGSTGIVLGSCVCRDYSPAAVSAYPWVPEAARQLGRDLEQLLPEWLIEGMLSDFDRHVMQTLQAQRPFLFASIDPPDPPPEGSPQALCADVKKQMHHQVEEATVSIIKAQLVSSFASLLLP